MEGDGGGSTLDFPFLSWLTLFFGLLLEIVISTLDFPFLSWLTLFLGLLLEIVISRGI